MEESDFVLYKNKDGAIESIGMPFENLFRNNNLPAMIGGGIGSHNKFGNIEFLSTSNSELIGFTILISS